MLLKWCHFSKALKEVSFPLEYQRDEGSRERNQPIQKPKGLLPANLPVHLDVSSYGH